MKVNRKLVSLKVYYCCYYAAAGTLLPLLTVHLKRLGITSTEAGFIVGITQVCSIFIRPVLGALADKHRKHKVILLLTLMLYSISFFSLMLVPGRVGSHSDHNSSTLIFSESQKCSDLHHDSSEKNWTDLFSQLKTQDNWTYTEHIIKSNEASMLQLTGNNCSETEMTQSKSDLDITFVIVFFVFLIARLSYSSMQSLLDTITYLMLGANRLLYSRQRLWGTAGTLFATVCLVFVIGEYYDAIFLMFGGFCLLTLVAGLTLDVPKTERDRAKLLTIVRQQISRGVVRWFLTKIFFCGMFLGVASNFLFWHFKDIGIGESFLAIIVLIYCVSSLTVLQATPMILRVFGPDACIRAAICVYAIRFLGVSFVKSQWYIIPLELLHGITYALFWAAASSKMSVLATDGSQGTFQGIAGAIYNDMGRGLGSIITGILFQRFDTRWILRCYSMVCGVLLFTFWCLDKVWGSAITTQKETPVDKVVESEQNSSMLKGEEV